VGWRFVLHLGISTTHNEVEMKIKNMKERRGEGDSKWETIINIKKPAFAVLDKPSSDLSDRKEPVTKATKQ
jgi:hypothetical protein